MIVCDRKEEVGMWVSSKIGNEEPWHLYEAVGILRDGKIIGGAVIDNYIRNARCSVHCAGESLNWCSRKFLYVVFDYIFRQLKCNSVINIVNSTNHKSLKFTSKIGFKKFYTIKGGGNNGCDGVMFEMRKEDCRWLSIRGDKK